MKNFLKWFFLGAIVLLGIFFLLRGCNPTIKEVVKTVHDTTTVEHTSIVYRDTGSIRYVKVLKTPIAQIPKKLQPSNNPDTLAIQYGKLLTEHTSKFVYLDTLKIDSIGWVAIEDTVQYNQLVNRRYQYSIKERVINNTTTITHTNPPKNLFFVGGEAMFSQTQVTGAQVGLILKNRKDNIIGISGGYDFRVKTPIYSLKYYTKLQL